MGYASKLNISAIEFGSFLKAIQNREISFVCLPVFIKKQDPKKRKREDQDESQGRKKKKEGKKKQVTYNEMDPQAKLMENQRFGDVFFKECREGIEQPCMDESTKMCNRLYGKGCCFEGCKRLHKKKNLEEQARWKRYLKDLLSKWKVKNNNGNFKQNGRS